MKRRGFFLAGVALALPAVAAELNISLDMAPVGQGWDKSSPYYTALAAGPARAMRSDLDLWFRTGGWNARGALRNVATEGRAPEQKAVLQQAYFDGELGAGQGYSVGKKVLSWGVGYGFRPLDVVQREDRRAANPPPLEGMPLLAWERFGAADAWSLVWVRPAAGSGADDGKATALAAHWYRLADGNDWHGVARLSARHGLEIGGGGAWIWGDEWAFHGAALYETRYRRRSHVLLENGGLLATTDPLQESPGRDALRAVAGAQWTGASGWSLLAEAWYDGEAWRAADWRQLHDLTRQQWGLAGFVPQSAISGNIAWSSRAFDTPNLLRENVLVRLSWEEAQRWKAYVECLATPRDGGRVMSASLAWTGDRQSLSAGLRVLGGKADSAYALSPLSRLAWLEWRIGFN